MKEIQLTQGKVALVDDDDYDRVVSVGKWLANKREHTYYAATSIKDEFGNLHSLKMHRFILGLTDPLLEVDHIDGDGLMNVRSNLRIVTHQENMKNLHRRMSTDGYKYPYRGVYFDSKRKKWRAMVRTGGKTYNTQRRDTAEEAAIDYDKKARELFGKFACLNFPD